jgi:sulfur carrier protein ThiS
MKLTVQLYGTLRRFSNMAERGIWVGEVPAGTTIRALIGLIGASEAEVAVASVNGKMALLDTKCREGDDLILVTPMGAG